jgi:hypothetical protein
VDSSILLVPGQYCRLELIDSDGKWLKTWQYTVDGQTVKHEQGESVGNLMSGWREARKKHPGLFTHEVIIWQSPTATVDSIVWSWQQMEEAGRFSCLVRLVDSLRTCWTEQSDKVNFACQTMQGCVPASCTPLVQVTDTGFAMPMKAAASVHLEKLQSRLSLKARLEKAPAQLKVGPAELLETALVMHRRAVELNEQHRTVLAEARACGWLHWRPVLSTGILQLSSSQQWADSFTEGSSRMDQTFREGRNDWVRFGVPQPLPAETAPQNELVTSYWTDQQPLVVEAEQDLLSEIDLRRLHAAMLHPSVRSEERKIWRQCSCASLRRHEK